MQSSDCKNRGGMAIMKGTEFIKMMREDIATVTLNKHDLEQVVECMEAVVSMHPGCDIDCGGSEKPKTPQGCYSFLKDYARIHKDADSYFMGPTESLKLVADYLGLKADDSQPAKVQRIVSLEDFI